MIRRIWRWAWLLVFFIPLTVFAGKFCSFAPTDSAYHGLVALHEALPQLVALAAALSMASVAYRIVAVARNLERIRQLESPAPLALADAFASEALRAGIAVPRLVYVTASTPLCFTAFGVGRATVFASRGFCEDLDDTELRLVARHEIAHVRAHDPAWNFFWHLAFAAFVVPGFAGLERTLRQRREFRANVAAASDASDAYEALLRRRADRHASLCFDGRVDRDRAPRIATAIVPLAVVVLFVGLGLSHAEFMRDLPYLTAHHC